MGDKCEYTNPGMHRCHCAGGCTCPRDLNRDLAAEVKELKGMLGENLITQIRKTRRLQKLIDNHNAGESLVHRIDIEVSDDNT